MLTHTSGFLCAFWVEVPRKKLPADNGFHLATPRSPVAITDAHRAAVALPGFDPRSQVLTDLLAW